MACIHLFKYSTTLSILLGYQLRSTHVKSSVNATPVVCDSKQVVEYGESDSNSTYCGKMSTYHVSSTFSNFFSINQMCIG